MIGEGILINEYQTPFDLLEIDKEPQEVQDQFWDCINNIPLVRTLISADRPRAKDLPRDEFGRIIVDVTKPHILEDMDYFRQTAITFQKTGRFTHLRPNGNPNSEYMKWLKEEVRRCTEGYVRPSDGEWITGDYYFFLNYCPILQADTSDSGKTKGKKMAKRISDFPKVWEGHYLRTHYLQQARENGNHASELSRRGSGKAHPMDVPVLTSSGWKYWGDVIPGDYLWGDDGNLTKVIYTNNMICPMYRITLADGRFIDCSEGHLWNAISHKHKGRVTLDTKYIYNTYKSSRKVSSRNPKGVEYEYSIVTNKGVEYPYNKTKIDPYTFGLLLGDGCFRVDGANKTYYTCHPDDWRYIKDFIPYKNVFKYNNTKYGYNLNIPNFIGILKEYGLFMCKSEDKFIPEEYLHNSKEVRLELLKGIMDSDGTTSGNAYSIDLASKRLRSQLIELCLSLGYNYRTSERKTGYKKKDGTYVECKTSYRLRIYTNDIICKLPRKTAGIKNRSKSNYANSKIVGTKIVNVEYIGDKLGKCVTVDNNSSCYLVGDFITTHNSYVGGSLLSKRFVIGESKEVCREVQCVVTAYEKKYISGANQILDMFKKYIDFLAINTELPSKRLVDSSQNLTWKMGYKDLDTGADKGTLNSVIGITSKDDESKLRGSRGVLYIIEEAGTFPRLLGLYATLRPSVEDGDSVFGLIYAYGTSGDEDSDFAALQEIMYNPKGYNMYALKNVYDKEGQGRPHFVFFFPGYMNRSNCYDNNGNSDVTKAILEILKDRFTVKYNSSDVNAVTKRISEIPITPQEAILRAKSNLFPITDLNERLNQIDNNPSEFDDVYVGNLVPNEEGGMDFRVSNSLPIRDFPIKDNKNEGAIEIFRMPEKDHNGKVFENRYIIGHDPVDDDEAQTASLTSTFVLDLFTDQIVAEYTGRHMMAEDNFEIVRRLCVFYNAKCLYESNKKGIFAYFQEKRCVHLLADTPQYLKDVDVIKSIGFGNKAKGVNATQAVNAYANKLIKEWLLKVNSFVKTLPYKDDNGEEYYKDVEVQEFNLYNIRNRALIKELIQYNSDGNFDRVRALGMVMLYRQQYLILYGGDVKEGVESYDDADYLGNDPFFTNNYGM